MDKGHEQAIQRKNTVWSSHESVCHSFVNGQVFFWCKESILLTVLILQQTLFSWLLLSWPNLYCMDSTLGLQKVFFSLCDYLFLIKGIHDNTCMDTAQGYAGKGLTTSSPGETTPCLWYLSVSLVSLQLSRLNSRYQQNVTEYWEDMHTHHNIHSCTVSTSRAEAMVKWSKIIRKWAAFMTFVFNMSFNHKYI